MNDGPPDGLGPGTLLYDLSDDVRWGLAIVRATVLEAAHPQIGAALVDSSTFVAHPWRRLANTLASTHRLLRGDAATRRREAARLNRLHARITGTDEQNRPYSALDPGARAWVTATLFESTVAMCRMSGQSLDGPTMQRLYTEFGAILALLDSDARMPPTLPEFWRYYEGMIRDELENTEAVRIVLHRVFTQAPAPPVLTEYPMVWAAGRAVAGPLATAITVASLPEPFRRQMGLTEYPGAQSLLHSAYLGVGLANRVLPRSWTRTTSIMDLLAPGGPAPTGPLLTLRRRAGQAGALLRLITPFADPAEPAAVRSADRFFAEVLDQTGNGYLDWPDVAAMAREIATRLDLDEPAETRLFAAYAAWWAELSGALDTDGDGRVSRQEYAEAATTMASPALIQVADVLFDITDTDGNETISVEEYQALFRCAFNSPVSGGAAELSRSDFVRKFLAFMSGRHHSHAYDRLLAQA
jgi:uncharacterized protein (DUF2236 family)